MKAYKVFDENWTCTPAGKPFKYEVGKTYKIKEAPVFCERGFHACKKVNDCFSYYSFKPENKIAEVELSGIILGKDGYKQCAQIITILKELTWAEMLIIANTGHGNSGHSNSGNSNSGHRNSGNSNSGHSNSGHRNSGNSNSGNRNSGNWNSGDGNSGNRNSGNRNSGHRNSGNRNSGNWNSGDGNSGHRNSGNWNSGDGNSGNFNSNTPETIDCFNKKCKREKWDNAEKPSFIYDINPNLWIRWGDMTDDEKIKHENAYVTNGYLKTVSYKEAWADAFKSASKKDVELLKKIPNFDATVFEEITGIKIF